MHGQSKNLRPTTETKFGPNQTNTDALVIVNKSDWVPVCRNGAPIDFWRMRFKGETRSSPRV